MSLPTAWCSNRLSELKSQIAAWGISITEWNMLISRFQPLDVDSFLVRVEKPTTIRNMMSLWHEPSRPHLLQRLVLRASHSSGWSPCRFHRHGPERAALGAHWPRHHCAAGAAAAASAQFQRRCRRDAARGARPRQRRRKTTEPVARAEVGSLDHHSNPFCMPVVGSQALSTPKLDARRRCTL